jgi:hypothetical protein
MRAVTIPAGLRERLITRLSNERNAFYRSWLLRGVSAAAAVLVVAIALVSLWDKNPDATPRVNLAHLIAKPQPTPKDPDDVPRWFAQRGIEVQLPAELADQWDFRFVTAAYFTEDNGYQIPTLDFKKDGSHVKVLLLRRGQYDPAELASVVEPQYPQSPKMVGKIGDDEYIALIVTVEGNHTEFHKQRKLT